MPTFPSRRRTFALIAGCLLFCASAGAVRADEIRVITSGAFTAAYLELIPSFERATHDTIVTSYGGSMGTAPDSIPSRLQRGEPADVVIMAASALDDLIKQGKVVAGSRVDLVRSSIGMAVRAGTPKPDISTVEALNASPASAPAIRKSGLDPVTP